MHYTWTHTYTRTYVYKLRIFKILFNTHDIYFYYLQYSHPSQLFTIRIQICDMMYVYYTPIRNCLFDCCFTSIIFSYIENIENIFTI